METRYSSSLHRLNDADEMASQNAVHNNFDPGRVLVLPKFATKAWMLKY